MTIKKERLWTGNGPSVLLLPLAGCRLSRGRARLAKAKKKNSEGVIHELVETCGCGSKSNRSGYAGFGPCFHLPGFHFGNVLFEPQPCAVEPPLDGAQWGMFFTQGSP